MSPRPAGAGGSTDGHLGRSRRAGRPPRRGRPGRCRSGRQVGGVTVSGRRRAGRPSQPTVRRCATPGRRRRSAAGDPGRAGRPRRRSIGCGAAAWSTSVTPSVDRAAAVLDEQLRDPVRGDGRQRRVDAALEALGRLAGQLVPPRGAGDRDRVEVRGLDQHVGGGPRRSRWSRRP